MLYQIIVAAGLAVFLVNLILNLRTLKRPSENAGVPNPAPLVSVLVPARNEEINIRNCLESLQKQDYPNYEVLVLDDNSDDRTAEIVTGMAAADRRIRLIHGEPLPDDWAGKPFACYQLARKARGEWLLFVDADTMHAPHMIRSVLDLALKSKVSMLSGFPRQLAKSLPLKIVMPLMYFVILGWLPLWWLQRPSHPKPSLAIGQFLLFPRDEYWRIGGHKAVQSRIVEDVWLGIEIGRHGGHHVAVDLSSVVECNMYDDIGAAWKGLGRSIYSVTAIAPLGLLGLVLAAMFFYVGPFFWLWRGFLVSHPGTLWQELVVFQVAVIFLMRWLVDNRFKEPAGSFFFHPLGFLFLFLDVLNAAGRWLVGAGVSWKERVYGGEESVVK
ncbi:MAG: glycosyltransferase [Dehalococcoidales bacterium]|jgi:chlorobactene glucosyltransferase